MSDEVTGGQKVPRLVLEVPIDEVAGISAGVTFFSLEVLCEVD